MSEQHTQWNKRDGGPLNNCLRIFADDQLIAIVGSSDQTMDQIKANANLIASAPELLEACQAALDQMEALDEVLNQKCHQVIGWLPNGEPEPITSFFEDCNEIGAFPKLRAAIAKAKGGGE